MAGRNGYSSRDEGHHGGHDAPVSPPSLEDAKHAFEQSKAESARALQETLSIQTRDGKQFFLGFQIPKEMARVLQYALSAGTTPLNYVVAPKIYSLTSDIASKLKATPKLSHGSGLVAAGIFSGLLVGAKPISDLVHANNERRRDTRELLVEIAPVMQLNKKAFKENEVIRTVRDHIQDKAMLNMKGVVADLPTIILNSVFAVQDHGELAKEMRGKFDIEQRNSSTVEALVAEAVKHAERYGKLQAGYETEIQKYKEKFFRDNKGKFDQEKLTEMWEGTRRNPGIEGNLRKKFEANIEGNHSDNTHSEKDAQRKEQLLRYAPWATGLLGEVFKASMGVGGDNEKPKIIAYDMIKRLKVAVEGRNPNRRKQGEDEYSSGYGSRNADDIMIDGMGVHEGERLSLKEFITEIFQQNERDRGRTVIGPALMEQLEPAIDRIAEVIADGRLDPLALVNLVGDGKVIVHRGKSLRKFADAADVDKLIDEQLAVMSAREQIDPKEFFANFSDPEGVQQSLKRALDGMTGAHRACFASLFPDDILEQAGVKKKEIMALRKQAHDHIYEVVANAVEDLAAKDEQELRKAGIPNNSIAMIKEMAEKIQSEGLDVVKKDVDGSDKLAMSAVRTALLTATTQNPGETEKYWSGLVSRARSSNRPERTPIRHEKHERGEDSISGMPDMAAREMSRRTDDAVEQRGV